MKENEEKHFVGRFTFDVELERQSDAKPVQDRLSEMFRNRIVSMMDKLLDDLDDPNFVIKIDTIEVDLGVLSESEFEGRLYFKIKEALEKKIRRRVNKILAYAGTDMEEGEKIPLAPAKIELLAYFLEFGRMPAGGDIFTQSIESILQDLLREAPAEVLAMLVKILPSKPQATRRIVRQFGRDTLESLIRLTAPTHIFFIQSREQEIVDGAAAVLSYGRSTVREEVRVAMLRYLFSQSDQRFTPESYQREMRKLLSEKFGSPIDSLLRDPEELDAAKSPATQGEDDAAVRHRALILRALRRGVQSITRSELLQAWEFLVRHEPEMLRLAIATAVDAPGDLVRLLGELPIPAIRLMVRNVVAEATDAVLDVVVAVIAAHASLNRGNDSDEKFVRAAYSALIYELAVKGTISLKKERIAEAIFQNLKEIPETPTELLEKWQTLEIPGVLTPAEKEAMEEEERQEAIRQAREEEELRQLTAQDQKKPDERIPEAESRDVPEAEADEPETLEEKLRKAREKQEKEKRRRAQSGDLPDEEQKEPEAQEEGDPMRPQPEELDPDWPLPVTREEAQEEIEAARRQAQEGPIDARPLEKRKSALPESLFEGEDEERRRMGLGEPEDITQSFDLASESARIEYVMYYFRYGEDPWWVENLRQRDIQALVVRLGKSEPRNLADATRELIFKTPPSLYPDVVARIIDSLDEVQRLLYMEKVIPDLVGFFATTTRALGLLYESKSGELNIPARLSSQQSFAWQVPMQYVFRYYSSRPTASELLRFVLKEMSQALGLDIAELVKELDQVAENAIGKGERRFSPFRTLLPDAEQPIQVPEPSPHPGAPEAQTTATDLPAGEDQAPLAGQDDAQDQIGREGPEIDAPEADPEKTVPSQDETSGEQPAQESSTEQEKEGKEKGPQPDEVLDGPDTIRPEEESLEDAPERKPTADSPESDPGKEPVEGDQTLDDKRKDSPGDPDALERTDGPEGKVGQEKSPDEAEATEIPEESPEERRKRLAAKRRERPDLGQAEWPESEMEPEDAEPLLLSVAELLEDEAESIRIIEYYLRYGALPHQDAAPLTLAVFRKLVLEVMVRHERAYVQMLRNIGDNLRVRLRLAGLGQEVAVQSVLHMNWMTGSGMQPFLDAILKLLGTSGAPIAAEPVMEHAVFYVNASGGSGFKPVEYIKALFRHLERYYKLEQAELVTWLIKKNEENSVPVKAILAEILEMIRLSVERRQVHKKPDKPDTPRYGNAGIPEDIEIFVQNAGMVLVWPFLYQYFQRLDVMTDERLFKDEEAMEKGAQMLQYMVTTEQKVPEEAMFLNKLLVGLPLDFPMHLEFEVTDVEKQITDSMLRSVADQWSMMKGAPPEQMRATFLVRDGIIKKDGDNWLLQVEKKGYDLVLKRLPWGLVQIRVPWLEYMINVEWG